MEHLHIPLFVGSILTVCCLALGLLGLLAWMLMLLRNHRESLENHVEASRKLES